MTSPKVRDIKVNCSQCYTDSTIDIKDVTTRTCVDDFTSVYRFRCPHCSMIEIKTPPKRVVSLLEEVGAEIELWQLPDDLFETHEGPLLTHDCLIDFHQSIEAHDRLVALIQ